VAVVHCNWTLKFGEFFIKRLFAESAARISMTWSNKRIIYHTYALLAVGLSRGADLLQAALLQHLQQCRLDGELWFCFGLDEGSSRGAIRRV
jgi:hypothetical protein